MALTTKENLVLGQFKAAVAQSLGNRLIEMKLFGSKARGDDRPDSDIDALVIVTDDDWHICDTVYDIATDLSLKTDIFISPKVISKGRFEELQKEDTSFLRNISRDAIAV
jgi:predicted nucleotidyltransferase